MKQVNKPAKPEPHWAQELVDNLNGKFAQPKTRKEILEKELQNKQK